MNKSLLLALIFCFTETIFAQTLRGQVVDVVTGRALTDATVTATYACLARHTLPMGASASNTTPTAANGEFTVQVPPSPCGGFPGGRFYSLSKPGMTFTLHRQDLNNALASDTIELGLIEASSRPLENLNAASFLQGVLAPEMLAAAFGNDLATTTATASTVPLPTALAGRSVSVRDSNGLEKTATLLYVSPAQINYVVPSGLSPEAITVKVSANGQVISAGFTYYRPVTPGLFTLTANGQGLAAAVVLRIRADGTQQFEPIARFDSASQRFEAIPIDLGAENEQVYLVLFGTGFREYANYDYPLPFIRISNGEKTELVRPIYMGPQGGFAGLDQVNLLLPTTLRGFGTSSLHIVDYSNNASLHLK